MTDKEIIKALEHCANHCNNGKEIKCDNCCAFVDHRCMCKPAKLLDLIRRQQAEIEKLKEVKHGHWIPQFVSSRGLTDKFACSVCNTTSCTSHKYLNCSYKYCKECGAKMELFGNPEQVKGENT